MPLFSVYIMLFILNYSLFCHVFERCTFKALHELLLIQNSVLNVFIWQLYSQCLAEWGVKNAVKRISKVMETLYNSKTKPSVCHTGSWHRPQSNNVKFNVIMWDLSSIQSKFPFWYRSFSPFSQCFYTVSFYQDSSSLENHLRGTTGQCRLVRCTQFMSCLKVIWQSKWTVAKGRLCSSGKI